jgi:hypothetical protein
VSLGGTATEPVTTRVSVQGRIKLEPIEPIVLKEAREGKCEDESKRCSMGMLDLSQVTIEGEFEFTLSSDFDVRGASLQIETPDGWIPLDSGDKTTLLVSGPESWPVRVHPLRLGTVGFAVLFGDG